DGEDGGSRGTNQVLRRSQPIECISDEWEVFLAGLGELESARVAHEQFHAEAGLQHIHLVADRALRLIEFFGRPSEAQGPGRGFEGPQGAQRWWNPSRQEAEIATSFELHLGPVAPTHAASVRRQTARGSTWVRSIEHDRGRLGSGMWTSPV